MSRYTVTYTIYIDAETDKHAVSKAEMIANREQSKYPAQRCEVEKIHSTPFASLQTREVDINKIKNESSEDINDIINSENSGLSAEQRLKEIQDIINTKKK